MRLLRLVIATALVAACTLGASMAAPAPADAQVLCGIFNACPPPPPSANNEITVRVDADPDGATDFAYSSAHSAVGQFSLDDDNTASLPAARSFMVAAGSVKVTQGAPADGYELRSIVCSDPSGGTTVDVAGRSATFNVSGGERVECTFKNVQPLTVRCPEGTVPNAQGECVINDGRVVCPSGTVKNDQGQCVISDGRVVCPSGTVKNAQGQCVISDGRVVCPAGTTKNAQGQCVVDGQHTTCPAGSAKTPDGECVVTDERVQCPSGSTKNSEGQCVAGETQCPAGSTKNAQGQCVVSDTTCPAGSTKNSSGQCVINETQCPSGSTRNTQGQCVINDGRVVCPGGTTPNAQGQCVVNDVVCPSGTVKNSQGQCVVQGEHTVCPEGTTRNADNDCVVTDDRVQCPTGSTKNASGACVVTDDRVQCPEGSSRNGAGQCVVNEAQCPEGTVRTAQGQCVINDGRVVCPSGTVKNAQGQCVVNDGRVVCPPDTTPNPQGQCVVNGEHTTCPAGSAKNPQGECVVTDDRVQCPAGSTRNAQGECVINDVQCPAGSTRNASGQCVVNEAQCPEGSTRNASGQCVINDDRVQCPSGSSKNAQGECVANEVACPPDSTPNGQGQCVLDGSHATCPEGSVPNGEGGCVVTDDRVMCPSETVKNAQGQCVVTDVQCPEGSTKNASGQCVVQETQDPPPTDPPPTDPPDDEPTSQQPPAQQPPAQEPSGGGTPPLLQPQSPGPPGPQPAEPPLDEPLPGSALVGVAQRISPPWAGLQLESGLFRNPLTGGESPGGYGPVMIGHALMRQGRRTGDASVTAAGVRAVSATVQSSTGIEENPLHLLAIASAYNWARRALAGNADFERDRPAWERYLATWKSTGVGPGAHSCFIDPECFHSYDLVDAVAVLELFATGLGAAAPDAKLADPAARTSAIQVLGRESYRAIGRSGRALGRGGRLYRLGILSDQPDNPLAYHALSIATLARGVELLGADAPPEALIALKRSIDATSSFTGPDGDVAYIGRAHGAVWALGATVYASQVCARVLPQIARSTAQRCETLALRTLRRIVREYSFGSAGVNAIPRFRTSQLDDRGLDPYANVISSAGLTAVFLEWGAVEEARRGGSAPREPVPLPLDRGGSFHDPTATRFAVMRTRSVWFAVHELAASLRDPRYDFGLISLKVRRGRGRDWSDVLPPRPLPRSGSGADSAGPVLIRGGRAYYPSGTRTTVNRRAGTVTVHGGWRTSRGRWIRRGVAFRFRAVANGVELSFPVEKGDRVAVSDFVPDRARIGRATIRASTFSSKLSPPAAARTTRSSGWSSAYDASLTRVRRTITARRDGDVSWTITAPRGR